MHIHIGVIAAILIVHYIADFVLQTDWQAKNKSSNNLALSKHVTVYATCMMVLGFFIFKLDQPRPILFMIACFVCHWVTDWFTSRLNKYLWEHEKNTHNFFVSIGMDQLLHYAQLFITYLILR